MIDDKPLLAEEKPLLAENTPKVAPIGKEQVAEATNILNKYKEGKANLEQNIINNEKWFKMRHWDNIDSKDENVEPTSAWLFNCIANKHADAMDNYPAPNILPREASDDLEAKTLSSIVPVIFEQNDFEKVYSDAWWYKLKNGVVVYAAYWDKTKLNGLGDIAIKKIDVLNLFWEAGITDIQHSKNIFNVELVDNDVLVSMYPQLNGKLSESSIDISTYVFDDTVDTTNKSAVIDWYYKKIVDGKTILHYVKYVNDEVLFATENDANFAQVGLYDHGKYPFIFDVLFPLEGTPIGFSYIDISKSNQENIDRLKQCFIKTALFESTPRYFIREDGQVNEEEFADSTNAFVHYKGNLASDSIIPIQANGLRSEYINLMANEVDELKETTGNRDVSTGGTNGVTAASAIAAMQEAGSKLSRDANKQSYRAYRELVTMVIELIRQFYDDVRTFRLTQPNGQYEFVQYSNENLKPQAQSQLFGADMGYRLPVFDVKVSAEKQSPYSKMSQNELALQFYGAGFFNPEMSQQALACLDMMDFNGKDKVMQTISQNGMMQQMMMQQMMMSEPMPTGKMEKPTSEESSITKNARERVANSTEPT